MTWFADFIVRLIRAGTRAYARKWSFLAVSMLIFLGSVALLSRLDLLPEAPPPPAAPTITLASSADAPAATPEAEFPTSIAIPAIRLTATIANPDTTVVTALDALLLKGAVRYPTSAKLGEAGNVVLFGHSSYLPVVGNQAYKTFNNIQKLVAGDVVTVYSSDRAYTYRVRSVAKESAASNEGIDLAVPGHVLTLVTCNSFGEKLDRFVVTADFVESHSVPS